MLWIENGFFLMEASSNLASLFSSDSLSSLFAAILPRSDLDTQNQNVEKIEKSYDNVNERNTELS